MISPDNFGKYFNNLRIILKYKLETLEYFERLVRLQELQKRASSRLFFERPILSMLRAIVYLPTHIWKYIDRKYDRFYVSKLKNIVQNILLFLI